MKNLLLTLSLCFIASNVFSQLYVAPNNNGTPGDLTDDTPSYVYVNDIQLFVTDGIELVENTNTTTEIASIYLRNDGQLFQGDAAVNSGTGLLSVYQESDADAWNYNFWSFPISEPDAGNAGNRNYGALNLYSPVSVTESIRATTVAGQNGTVSPFAISRRWTYGWDTPSQSWYRIWANTVIPAGEGMIAKGVGVDIVSQTYDFRGRPNNGEFILPTQTGVAFWDGLTYDFTLTGNPYPSALNLYRVAYDADNWVGPPVSGNPGTTSIINAFYYWDEDRGINSHLYTDNRGGYGIWLPGSDENDGGVYTVAPFLAYNSDGTQNGNPGSLSGVSYERLNAPIGQGFMIRANETNNIHIKNSHRRFIREGAANFSEFRGLTNETDSEIATTIGNTPPVDTKPQIRLFTYFGERGHVRDMVLLFNDDATDQYDSLKDADHPMDADIADAYFTINGAIPDKKRNFVIQTIPFDNPQKRVPISFRVDEPKKVSVKVVEQINTPFQKAYIFDSEEATYKEITNNKSATYLLEEGVYEGRFFIVFRGSNNNDDPTIIDADVADGLLPGREAVGDEIPKMLFFQNNQQQQLEVTNVDEQDIKLAHIFDMTGKLVHAAENLGTSPKFTFPTYNFSDGVYLVKLTTAENKVIDYKINVFNK